MKFWHMQMFPSENRNDYSKFMPWILEHRGFIGLGHWTDENGDINHQINDFIKKMKVNDIVAIRDGAKFIALVQVIGGDYFIENDQDERTHWIKYRRPIRVLDWEIDGKLLRQCDAPLGTLKRCKNDDAPTTLVITKWWERVQKSLIQRGIELTV